MIRNKESVGKTVGKNLAVRSTVQSECRARVQHRSAVQGSAAQCGEGSLGVSQRNASEW